ncbi:MAG: hypothetical protein ABIJ86_05385, partial [Spirochaetota bacterium]
SLILPISRVGSHRYRRMNTFWCKKIVFAEWRDTILPYWMVHMYRRISAMMLFIFIILGLAASVSGEEREARFGLDTFIGTPSAMDDVFKGVFPGLSLRFMLNGKIGFSLDYAFIGFEYYYPESPSGPWIGPVAWSSMPARFADLQADWIFYQTRHFIAPQVWYVTSLDSSGQEVSVRLGAGPAFSFLIPAESALYYPGLSDAFEQFNNDFEIHPGWSFRLGFEYRPRFARFLRLGAEYLFLIDSLTAFASEVSSDVLDYVDRSGNFLLFLGVRL